jgi:competence protein ComEA
MFKKLLMVVATFIMTMGLAFAGVDVNKADQAALDGVKGIGPKISKSILAERAKNGEFKDWSDFQKRVTGIGDKNAVTLSKAGLTVNGESNPKAGPPAANVRKPEQDATAPSPDAAAKKPAKVNKVQDSKGDKSASPTPAAK